MAILTNDLAALTKTVEDLTVTVANQKAESEDMQADLNAFYLMWAGARVVAASREERMVLSPPSARAAQVR